MRFRTEIPPLDYPGLINHSTPVVMLGSCFSDNIGLRLRERLIPALVNPMGTLYNPRSIETVIRRIIDGTPFTIDDLIQHGRTYHSFLCHSSLSSVDPELMLRRLNQRLETSADIIRRCGTVAVTVGTAYVFTHNRTGLTVANCHKLPAAEFTRSRLSVEEATESLSTITDMITSVNPDVKIIFTVSPIRHMADGAHGNQLSKSTLLLAVDNTVASHPDNTIYMPAYELVLDDLRDYRFYAADMCHPSDTAADYVYEYFERSFFDEPTRILAARCLKMTRRMTHRHMSDDTEAIEAFAKATEAMRSELLMQHPYLNLSINLAKI